MENIKIKSEFGIDDQVENMSDTKKLEYSIFLNKEILKFQHKGARREVDEFLEVWRFFPVETREKLFILEEKLKEDYSIKMKVMILLAWLGTKKTSKSVYNMLNKTISLDLAEQYTFSNKTKNKEVFPAVEFIQVIKDAVMLISDNTAKPDEVRDAIATFFQQARARKSLLDPAKMKIKKEKDELEKQVAELTEKYELMSVSAENENI